MVNSVIAKYTDSKVLATDEEKMLQEKLLKFENIYSNIYRNIACKIPQL